MKKVMMMLIGVMLLACTVKAQDSALYITDSKVYYKTYFNGNVQTTFKDTVETYTMKVFDGRHEYYKKDTLYQMTVYEGQTMFYYHLYNGKWELTYEVVVFSDSIQPYYINRCKALTKKKTRCKRKGDPYCWQHN